MSLTAYLAIDLWPRLTCVVSPWSHLAGGCAVWQLCRDLDPLVLEPEHLCVDLCHVDLQGNKVKGQWDHDVMNELNTTNWVVLVWQPNEWINLELCPCPLYCDRYYIMVNNSCLKITKQVYWRNLSDIKIQIMSISRVGWGFRVSRVWWWFRFSRAVGLEL